MLAESLAKPLLCLARPLATDRVASRSSPSVLKEPPSSGTSSGASSSVTAAASATASRVVSRRKADGTTVTMKVAAPTNPAATPPPERVLPDARREGSAEDPSLADAAEATAEDTQRWAQATDACQCCLRANCVSAVHPWAIVTRHHQHTVESFIRIMSHGGDGATGGAGAEKKPFPVFDELITSSGGIGDRSSTAPNARSHSDKLSRSLLGWRRLSSAFLVATVAFRCCAAATSWAVWLVPSILAAVTGSHVVEWWTDCVLGATFGVAIGVLRAAAWVTEVLLMPAVLLHETAPLHASDLLLEVAILAMALYVAVPTGVVRAVRASLVALFLWLMRDMLTTASFPDPFSTKHSAGATYPSGSQRGDTASTMAAAAGTILKRTRAVGHHVMQRLSVVEATLALTVLASTVLRYVLWPLLSRMADQPMSPSAEGGRPVGGRTRWFDDVSGEVTTLYHSAPIAVECIATAALLVTYLELRDAPYAKWGRLVAAVVPIHWAMSTTIGATFVFLMPLRIPTAVAVAAMVLGSCVTRFPLDAPLYGIAACVFALARSPDWIRRLGAFIIRHSPRSTSFDDWRHHVNADAAASDTAPHHHEAVPPAGPAVAALRSLLSSAKVWSQAAMDRPITTAQRLFDAVLRRDAKTRAVTLAVGLAFILRFVLDSRGTVFLLSTVEAAIFHYAAVLFAFRMASDLGQAGFGETEYHAMLVRLNTMDVSARGERASPLTAAARAGKRCGKAVTDVAAATATVALFTEVLMLAWTQRYRTRSVSTAAACTVEAVVLIASVHWAMWERAALWTLVADASSEAAVVGLGDHDYGTTPPHRPGPDAAASVKARGSRHRR